MEENTVRLFGINPNWRKEFEEAKALLLEDEDRANWHRDHLMRVFEDLLHSAGASTYPNGRIATLGAWMSVLDTAAVKEVLQSFSDEELGYLKGYYRGQGYLSPIYSMLASQIEIYFDSLARRHVAAIVEKLPHPMPLSA